MYLQILKKDLKRKRAMNIILLVFIILAAMFVSSSVNNIISVTTALDSYLEMADAPDYMAATMDKSGAVDIDGIVEGAASIESSSKEKILYISSVNVSFEDEDMMASYGTNILQSDKDMSMNYFLDDGSILETVKPGELYMTVKAAEDLGLEAGDKITIEIEDVSREFTFAGGFKDAVFGSNQVSVTRYIVSASDFENYISVDAIKQFYGGALVYINASSVETMLSEVTELTDSIIFSMDREYMKFTYIFDMIVTGVLLVVSLILIAVAFVVLRFTITFTLSEEFREIGVMKAIGIGNMKIRGLYLTKYAALSVIGAAIGLALSFPFGEMLMSVSSQSVIMSDQNPVFVNIVCTLSVVGVILLFCFGCTGKVRKMTPIDAIRNGQTGERFRKKSLMSLQKSKLPATTFLSLNDIVSSPKRYGIITFTFVLCLSLLLILSISVTTLKSDCLVHTFGIADFHLTVSGEDDLMAYMASDGHENMKEDLEDMEKTLSENGMPADCVQETIFNLTVSHREYKKNISIFQGTGTTTDMYKYTAGTAPEAVGEVAVTKLSADSLNVEIGDTVTIDMLEGEKEFIVTGFFQSMINMGDGIRFHEDESIDYIQANGMMSAQIIFTDDPDEEEISRRIQKIQELYPEFTDIQTAAEWVEDCTGVAATIDAVKTMAAVLTIVLAALITVLMERSFIAKEKGEIALMKAMGFRNSKICAYHTGRFAIVGIIAVIIAEILAMPLTHLCIDPVFKMMGMELAVEYIIDPLEMFLTFPLVILVTTVVSAFLTSLYTGKIKSSDTAGIE